MVSIMSFSWLLPLLFISCYPKFTNTYACDTLQAGDPEDACEYWIVIALQTLAYLFFQCLHAYVSVASIDDWQTCNSQVAAKRVADAKEKGKTCTTCHILQPLSHFDRSNGSLDGRNSICSACRAEVSHPRDLVWSKMISDCSSRSWSQLWAFHGFFPYFLSAATQSSQTPMHVTLCKLVTLRMHVSIG